MKKCCGWSIYAYNSLSGNCLALQPNLLYNSIVSQKIFLSSNIYSSYMQFNWGKLFQHPIKFARYRQIKVCNDDITQAINDT